MKKVIIFNSVVLLIVVALIMTYKFNIGNNSDVVNEIYKKYSTDIDRGVEYFRDSTEFENMNKNARIEEMGELLKLYQKDKIISNLYYDESSESYTFSYGKGDIEGALGGVSLKEWNPMFN